MSDISIPLSALLWMAPIVMPYLSIPAAFVAGYVWYRRSKNVYAALVAAVVAAFLVPWSVLFVLVTGAQAVEAWTILTPLGKGVLALLVALVLVGLVIWGASYAGSRSRGRR
jgi:hypothetical protein